uniref:Uncharacterized protein n=1 Tax=Onchocerca volvulus TaxID=6282 RepID=A0A8R1TR78_ONCVO
MELRQVVNSELDLNRLKNSFNKNRKKKLVFLYIDFSNILHETNRRLLSLHSSQPSSHRKGVHVNDNSDYNDCNDMIIIYRIASLVTKRCDSIFSQNSFMCSSANSFHLIYSFRNSNFGIIITFIFRYYINIRSQEHKLRRLALCKHQKKMASLINIVKGDFKGEIQLLGKNWRRNMLWEPCCIAQFVYHFLVETYPTELNQSEKKISKVHEYRLNLDKYQLLLRTIIHLCFHYEKALGMPIGIPILTIRISV